MLNTYIDAKVSYQGESNAGILFVPYWAHQAIHSQGKTLDIFNSYTELRKVFSVADIASMCKYHVLCGMSLQVEMPDFIFRQLSFGATQAQVRELDSLIIPMSSTGEIEQGIIAQEAQARESASFTVTAIHRSYSVVVAKPGFINQLKDFDFSFGVLKSLLGQLYAMQEHSDVALSTHNKRFISMLVCGK